MLFVHIQPLVTYFPTLVTYHYLNNTFRSSYDDSVRMLAGRDYKGPVCPKWHRLTHRVYKRSGMHYCDECAKVLDAGSCGQWCKVRTSYEDWFFPYIISTGLRFRPVRNVL